MSDFRIFETDRFLEDLDRLTSAGKDKIVAKLKSFVYPRLREQPYFGANIKKLKGYKPETWRYRIGSYRFFYVTDDQEKVVFMIAADTRQKSY